MKKINLLKAASTVLALSMVMAATSCAKDGPAGPAGPQGPAGPAGNANVKSSVVFVSGSEWTNSESYSFVTRLMPEITADILNKGAVLVYVELTAGKWDAIPTAFGLNTGHVGTYNFYIEPGKLTLEATINDAITLTAADHGNTNFKVVIIAGSAIMANPGVQPAEIEEVKQHLAE